MNTISLLAQDFLAQKTIAVIGISSSKQTVANGVYKKLKNKDRTIFAVGKNSTIFENEQCYPDLTSLPAPIDGVFVAAKKENVEHVIDECIALKIPRIWIHNIGGTAITESSPISETITKKCREHNITLIPGACPMMFVDDADIGHKCIKWFLNVTGKLK